MSGGDGKSLSLLCQNLEWNGMGWDRMGWEIWLGCDT